MNFQVGTNLQKGKYVLKAILGQGPFAMTYQASYGTHAHPVVIKTLNDRLRPHPEFGRLAQKFLADAQGIAQCQHPNLVRILDGFVQESLPYIVMEYVPGPSLAQILQAGHRLSVPQALEWIEQVGSALHLLHQNGCLHRDVTPQNMIRRQVSGEVVLTDFGMAWEFIPGTIQTQTYLLSSGYAAPEHAQGRTSVATDIYGLCATLYHLLVGQPPVAAQMRDRVPLLLPRQLQPTLSSALEQALLQGLQIDPYRRPQTVADWLDLLPSEQLHYRITRQVNRPPKTTASLEAGRQRGYAIPPFRQSSILKSPIKKPVATTQSSLFSTPTPRSMAPTNPSLDETQELARQGHSQLPTVTDPTTLQASVTVQQTVASDSPPTAEANLHPSLETQTNAPDSSPSFSETNAPDSSPSFSETPEEAAIEPKESLGCWLPLLFIVTSVIAGLGGVIFGLSLRYGATTSSNYPTFPTKQSFPSTQNWPGAVTPLGPPAPTFETSTDSTGYRDRSNSSGGDRITENGFSPAYSTTEESGETLTPIPEANTEIPLEPTIADDSVTVVDGNGSAVNAENEQQRTNSYDSYDSYEQPAVTPGDAYGGYPDPRSPIPATEELPATTPDALETEAAYRDPTEADSDPSRNPESDPYTNSYSDPYTDSYSGSDPYYDPSQPAPLLDQTP